MSDPLSPSAADPDELAAAGGANAQPTPAAEPPDPDDVNALARMIFAESANMYRIPDAMEGIGWVAQNRVGARGFPDTLHGVLTQTGRNSVPQFQATGNAVSKGNALWQLVKDPSQLTGANSRAYQRAHDVAQGILSGQIPDPTGGATFYKTTKWSAYGPYAPVPVPSGNVATVKPIGSFDQGYVTFYNRAPSLRRPVSGGRGADADGTDPSGSSVADAGPDLTDG